MRKRPYRSNRPKLKTLKRRVRRAAQTEKDFENFLEIYAPKKSKEE